MRVAVICEFSGVVREALRRAGHDAVSFDLLPSEQDGPHVQGDVKHHDLSAFEAGVCFPPCTHLAVSGARWFAAKRDEQNDAIAFVCWLLALPFAKLAIENPIGVLSTHVRKPDQIIQPWQFGHAETKATCLWLRGFPPLTPTNIVAGRCARVHREPPGPNRWRNRSRTYQGIADAMAAQWF